MVETSSDDPLAERERLNVEVAAVAERYAVQPSVDVAKQLVSLGLKMKGHPHTRGTPLEAAENRFPKTDVLPRILGHIEQFRGKQEDLFWLLMVLGEWGDETAIPPIVEVIRKEEELDASISALAHIGGPAALQELERLAAQADIRSIFRSRIESCLNELQTEGSYGEDALSSAEEWGERRASYRRIPLER